MIENFSRCTFICKAPIDDISSREFVTLWDEVEQHWSQNAENAI